MAPKFFVNTQSKQFDLRINQVSTLLNNAIVDQAWIWLCRQGQHYPPNSDIWHLRFHKARLLPEIISQVKSGQYRFSAPQLITKSNGESIVLWTSNDAFVQKILALILADILPVHTNCAHVQHHGGHKGSVNRVQQWLRDSS